MPIDKSVNPAPDGGILVIAEGEAPLPDVEVILDEEGGATIEIGGTTLRKLTSTPT